MQFNPTNKYGARQTYSELCQRTFHSKAEAVRGEELRILEMAGEISALVYQPSWVLSESPKMRYTADFQYTEGERTIVEDVKGRDTRDSTVRRAWLKQRYGIEVKIIRGGQR